MFLILRKNSNLMENWKLKGNKAKRFAKQHRSNVIKAKLALFVFVCVYLRVQQSDLAPSYSAFLSTAPDRCKNNSLI